MLETKRAESVETKFPAPPHLKLATTLHHVPTGKPRDHPPV